MRWSNLFVPTLREAPGDAVAASHKLLIRGGFIRQLFAGHYTLLPLGLRVHEKVAQVVRDEMNAMGAQEFLMPAMHPAAIWQQSGRWETMGEEMFRLQDRKGADVVLGMTHEEIFATVAMELGSYKQLPQQWYQIQWKFRDEPRPKSGLLRVREFAMKDAYSFDLDEAGLDASFELYREAYLKIFARLDLDAMPVEASSGAMGGSGSTEFMVASEAGEDDVVVCPTGDYAANVERGTSALPAADDSGVQADLEMFDTPGVRTIAALADFEGGAAADRQLKTLLYLIDGELVLAVVRGDQQLNEQKLADHTGAIDMRPAQPEEIFKTLGAHPGSLGAVGVFDHKVYVDPSLQGRTGMTTGANIDDKHFRGVDVDRDIPVDEWVDLREVAAGEACVRCGTALEVRRCIEAGHIFKLGRQYAEALGLRVLDQNGVEQTPIMGSYGIGIGRNMAAVAETHFDDNGLIWPISIAPFEVVITVMRVNDEASMSAAEQLYGELRRAGIDALLDDRDARAGVKFADAELIGIPFRITIGPKGLDAGEVELTPRSTGHTENVGLDAVAAKVTDLVTAARS